MYWRWAVIRVCTSKEKVIYTSTCHYYFLFHTSFGNKQSSIYVDALQCLQAKFLLSSEASHPYILYRSLKGTKVKTACSILRVREMVEMFLLQGTMTNITVLLYPADIDSTPTVMEPHKWAHMPHKITLITWSAWAMWLTNDSNRKWR